ncbi:MAG: diacylglycerol kinase family protein [Polyangiaceae bacterium]
MAERFLLVGNPTAQSGKNKERIATAIAALRDRGAHVELLPTEPDGRTVGAVTRALDAGRAEVVIAMGGDGTFREVATGLVGSARRESVAMGMLPTGTANDQGKSFGLDAAPSALRDNVEAILAGHETRLDAGVITARGERLLFFDSAGWGLMARVLAQRNRDRRVVEGLGPLKVLYRDHAVYVGAFVKTFLESYVVEDHFRVSAVLDGKRHELDHVTDLVLKNTRVYAGSWVLDPTARHDDGALEFVPFRGKRDWASKTLIDLEGGPLAAAGITEAKLNEIGLEHSKPIRFSRAEISIAMPEGGAENAFQVDGEEVAACDRAIVEVLPRVVRLLVPRAFARDA